MNPTLALVTKNLTKHKGASKDVITKVSSLLDFAFPQDYSEFMQETNGGEGSMGQANYLILWKIEELAKLNKEYDAELYAPGYLIIGSNGGGTAYAFDKSKSNVVSFEFVGMTMEEEAQLLGNDFTSFLQNLSTSS